MPLSGMTDPSPDEPTPNGSTLPVRRVAVIGAGAAGLVTARELGRQGVAFSVFESRGEVGGLWNYEAPSTLELSELDVRHSDERVRSPLYPSLRTNLPRRLMEFRDFAFDDPDEEGQRQEFPRHEAVRRYLARFAESFALIQHVRFEDGVQQVAPLEAGHGFVVRANSGSQPFDAVAICSGHYFEPNLIELDGLDRFPGVVLHSHVYRSPAPFADQRVLVVGAASSGLDLAHELSSTAEQVFLSAFDPAAVSVAAPVEPCAAVQSLEADGSVVLVDGAKLARIDSVLLCTGYRYHFPFLPEGLVQVEPGCVAPLYLDLLHVEMPRLAFVGLPFKVVPFPQFEIQAKLFARYLSGTLQIPDRVERRRLHESERAERAARGESLRHALRHGARQFGYYNHLAQLIGEPPLPDWFQPLYDAVSESRRRHPGDYRDC